MKLVGDANRNLDEPAHAVELDAQPAALWLPSFLRSCGWNGPDKPGSGRRLKVVILSDRRHETGRGWFVGHILASDDRVNLFSLKGHARTDFEGLEPHL